MEKIPNKTLFLSSDENNRKIFYYNLKNTLIIGNSLFYPDILLYSFDTSSVYAPIKEEIMSLRKIKPTPNINVHIPTYTKTIEENVFFFIYNTDNYYHFLYDTLPYLITFNHLRKLINIKLLMNYPNSQASEFYKFVLEFLEILGISKSDILIVEKNVLYKNIFISTSYTHDIDSNLPPRNEIYSFYKEIANKLQDDNSLPKKIYISRRTWVHNDRSNIGTDYTQRRVMINETELVNYLIKKGYSEVFTEQLSIITKIKMFKNATHVIGAIGGGLANVLFSNDNCKLIPICSPDFLNINQRFLYSFKNVNFNIFSKTAHVETGYFKKFMRIKYLDIIGEIIDIKNDELTINYTDEVVAGWNNNSKYKEIKIKSNMCIPIDNGLNSAWKVDLDELYKIL